MAEEAKKSTRKSKSVGEKATAKPVSKQAISSVKKEEVLANKKILSQDLFKQGDLIQASVFCGKRGSARIIEISSDIVTVEFEGKIYTTKVKNIRKIKE